MQGKPIFRAGLCAILSPALLIAPISVQATTPLELQRGYAVEATRESAAFREFSAMRGRRFFNDTHGGDWRCTNCHGVDPTRGGRHAVTGRALAPLAPAANPVRFSDAGKVEKWFRRNCRDVVGRECTAQEKGDILAWLMSLPAGGVR